MTAAMVEKVARAICEVMHGPGTGGAPFDKVRQPYREELFSVARAAIEAVRKCELTDAQCDAGFKAGEFAGHGPEDPQWNAMRRIFPAIIDAALNE